MKITIYGAGYVGLIGAVALAKVGHTVVLLDVDKYKVEQIKAGISPIYEENLTQMLQDVLASQSLIVTNDFSLAVAHASLQMICVGTPTNSDGNADLRYIKSVVESIVNHHEDKQKKVIIEKSTVPVGTHKVIMEWIMQMGANTTLYEVASNPEFLREGKALHDFMHPDRIVVGTSSKETEALFEELYEPFTSQSVPLLFTAVASAELIKQAANSFLAMKISYANMLAEVSERVDADVTEVTTGIGLDKRIGSEFLQAGIGFGGSCFPKDLQAFIRTGEEIGLNLGLLRETLYINNRQRDRLISKITQTLGDLHDKRLAILGLAFKPNTDDVRETPAFYIVRELLGRQATLHLYDPIAMPHFQKNFKGSATLHYASSLKEALEDVDAIVMLTAWDEFLHADYVSLVKNVSSRIIFDARNALNAQALKQAGFLYHGMGALH